MGSRTGWLGYKNPRFHTMHWTGCSTCLSVPWKLRTPGNLSVLPASCTALWSSLCILSAPLPVSEALAGGSEGIYNRIWCLSKKLK